MIAAPDNIQELAELIRSSRKILAFGARTKPALSRVGDSVPLVSTRNLSGVTEYEPAEFTFTAKAGTPLAEIVRILGEQGQYLPFDPPLVESGATIGGTVAAGLSGPGRFRFGGIRDFILAIEFLDGNGALLRGGAKVVKNAAGFDLPKFFTGSCGRFGVLTEVTFKVFPRPPAMRSFRIPCATSADAVEIISSAAQSRREFDAIDYSPDDAAILMRMRGPHGTVDALEADLYREFPSGSRTDDSVWREITELRFASHSKWLVRRASTLKATTSLMQETARRGARCHISGGGSIAWLHGPDSARIEDDREQVLRGAERRVSFKSVHAFPFERRLSSAFDPDRKFCDLM